MLPEGVYSARISASLMLPMDMFIWSVNLNKNDVILMLYRKTINDIAKPETYSRNFIRPWSKFEFTCLGVPGVESSINLNQVNDRIINYSLAFVSFNNQLVCCPPCTCSGRLPASVESRCPCSQPGQHFASFYKTKYDLGKRPLKRAPE